MKTAWSFAGKIIGWLCFISINSILVTVFSTQFIYFYFSSFHPLIFINNAKLGTLSTLTGTFIMFNIAFNLFKTAFTSPGHPRRLYPTFDKVLAKANKSYCYFCEYYMPEGTFHCSTCEACILSMTQHCYFANNCIGKQNFKYFYLFMIWILIGSLFVCALLGQSFLRIFLKDAAFLNLIKDQKKIIVFTFVFCFALLFSVSILFGYYTYWSIDQRRKEFEIKSNKYIKLSQSNRGRVIAAIYFLKTCLLPFFEQERHAEDFSHVI